MVPLEDDSDWQSQLGNGPECHQRALVNELRLRSGQSTPTAPARKGRPRAERLHVVTVNLIKTTSKFCYAAWAHCLTGIALKADRSCQPAT